MTDTVTTTCELCGGPDPTLGTTEGQWVSEVCALYVPGVSLVPDTKNADQWLVSGVPAALATSSGGAVCVVCNSARGAMAHCAARGCGLPLHPSCALRSGLRLGSVAHFGVERYFVLCQKHSAAGAQSEPEPVTRVEVLGGGGVGVEASGGDEKFAPEDGADTERRRESKASKLVRLSGSAAQVSRGGLCGVRRVEPWWTALPEYVPPVAWPTLLPLGTERSSHDDRRWRVCYEAGQHVWEPLVEDSDALEREEMQTAAPSADEKYEERDADVIDAKLGPGAAECGWRIVEAYLGARKVGNWQYISPRGVKYKTKVEAHAARSAGADFVPRVKLVMSRGGQPEGAGAAESEAAAGAEAAGDEGEGDAPMHDAEELEEAPTE